MVKSYQQFNATNRMFREVLDITSTPLTYDQWMEYPEEDKAAVLFVNFFSAILKAWIVCRTPAAIEEECVSTVIQYLTKNVKKIASDSKRYTPQYIYTVAYNSMYSISQSRVYGQASKTSWYNNVVNFDAVAGGSNRAKGNRSRRYLRANIPLTDRIMTIPLEESLFTQSFWNTLHSKGKDIVDVAEYLINGNFTKIVDRRDGKTVVRVLSPVSASKRARQIDFDDAIEQIWDLMDSYGMVDAILS